MTQQELEREVANATGEALSEIRSRGFSIADPNEVCFDPEPFDLPPQVVDWDADALNRNVALIDQPPYRRAV
ncbi:MAG: hypothetical protein NXI22_04255 [bacterium]|nr:hypothetical protein [bacterium]